MGFDINTFAEEFKNTINWMLRGSQAQNIKNNLRDFKNNKNTLETHPDSLEALQMIIGLIKTNSSHFKPSREFKAKMESFIDKYGTNFRTPMAKDELIKLVGDRKKNAVVNLLKYSTVKQFTEHLYDKAEQGDTDVLGEKGRDNYLRDFGYFKRIPIDIHERRFLIRSGIYHTCSSNKKMIPQKMLIFRML
jgi:hypothetical protein